MLQPGPLSDQHLVKLYDIFVSGFSLPEFEIVVLSINRSMDSVSTSKSERFFAVLKQSRREGWMIELTLAAHHRNPANAALAEFVRDHIGPEHVNPQSQQAVTAPADPFTVSFLRSNNSVPFVNRSDLRLHLRQMFDIENGPRIMAVDSSLQRCGKSYTVELIRFLARHHDQRTAYVNIVEEWRPGFGPGQLAELLAEQIGMDVSTMPAREAQVARWNKELCRWLTREINATGDFWWIVIDGLGQAPNRANNLDDFIHELATIIERDDQSMNRLVLISFAVNDLPLNLRARTLEEIIHDHIGIHHLSAFFSNQVEQFRSLHNLDGAELEEVPQTLTAWVQSKLEEYPEEDQPDAIEFLIVKAMKELNALVNEN